MGGLPTQSKASWTSTDDCCMGASSVTCTTSTWTSLVGCLEVPIDGEVMLGSRALGPWRSRYLVTAGAVDGRTCRQSPSATYLRMERLSARVGELSCFYGRPDSCLFMYACIRINASPCLFKVSTLPCWRKEHVGLSCLLCIGALCAPWIAGRVLTLQSIWTSEQTF